MNPESNPERQQPTRGQTSQKQRFHAGVDRRSFLMRSAVIGAAAVLTGKAWTPEARAQQAAKEAAAPKLGAAPSLPTWTS